MSVSCHLYGVPTPAHQSPVAMLQPSHFVFFSVTTFSHLRMSVFLYYPSVWSFTCPVCYHNFLCHRKSVTTNTSTVVFPSSLSVHMRALPISHPLSHIHFFRFHRWPFVVLLCTKNVYVRYVFDIGNLAFWLEPPLKSLFALAITSLVQSKILKGKFSGKRTATLGCECSLVANLKSPQAAIKGRKLYLWDDSFQSNYAVSSLLSAAGGVLRAVCKGRFLFLYYYVYHFPMATRGD